MFLRNRWYVAAWADDVGREPLGRILLGDYVCLYRKEDGTPVALENRCPHRNLPLSEGNLIGDNVQCAYHGLEFDETGACVHVPGQPEAPEWACVRTYPLVERHRWLLIWMGDPAEADEALIPDFHRNLSDPDWDGATGQTYVKAGYRLVLDNLLDLSHLSYVHSSSTGNRAVAEEAELINEFDGDIVNTTRWMPGIEAASAIVDFAGYQGEIDRWQYSRYLPPSYIYICNGTADAGKGPPQSERGQEMGQWGFHVYHAMTPETDTRTHQFWAVIAPKKNIPAGMEETFRAVMRNVLAEDLDVYEAQQKAIDLDPEAVDGDANPKGIIPADGALIEMRKVIRRLHRAEQQAARAAE